MPIYTPVTGENWPEKLPPICPECGYNLTGLRSLHCPECGWRVIWSTVQQNARTTYHALKQIEDVNDLVDFGPYLAGATFVVLFFFRFVGWDELGAVLAVALSLATIVLGVQPFRIRPIPEHARNQLKCLPKRVKGLIVVGCGIFIIVLTLLLS